MANFEALIMRGLRSAQPAFGQAGRLYYVTDENTRERDSGSAWEDVSASADLSAYVAKALFDAQTILHATSDNTPAALTVGEATMVGRQTGGNISAIAQVSAGEKTAGTETALRGFSPDDVKDMIDTHGGSGRVLIEEVTPSGTGTVTFYSIPGTYKKLIVELMARGTAVATSVIIAIQLNGDTTAANYRSSAQWTTSSSAGSDGGDNNNLGAGAISADSSPAGAFSSGIVEIIQYANTNFNKQVLFHFASRRDASSAHEIVYRG